MVSHLRSKSKEVLTKYSILTRRASLVPAWSFGLWLSTSFKTSYDERSSTTSSPRCPPTRSPVEVFDCFWLRAFHWCDFIFSPNIVLKGFKKVMIKAGQTKSVSIPIDVSQLRVWDVKMNYVVEPGDFVVWVGSSSKDLRGNATFTVS